MPWIDSREPAGKRRLPGAMRKDGDIRKDGGHKKKGLVTSPLFLLGRTAFGFLAGGYAGIRTQGPILKRDVLYRLSYVTSGI